MTIQTLLNWASSALGISAFFIVAARNRIHRQPSDLKDLLGKALAASTIPTGVLLLACAFKPSLLQNLNEFN